MAAVVLALECSGFSDVRAYEVQSNRDSADERREAGR
jgi:hypothetical protein